MTEPRIVSSKEQRDSIKQKVRQEVVGYYDLQKLRIATGNRLVASILPDLEGDELPEGATTKAEAIGIVDVVYDEDGNPAEADKKKKDNKLKKFMVEYNKVTEACILASGKPSTVKNSISRIGAELSYIKSEQDYNMMKVYSLILEAEVLSLKNVKRFVEEHPLWDTFFSKVKGCGPLMSAVCLCYFDINAGRHISSFWRYAGLDVVLSMNNETGEIIGEGRGRHKDHLVEQTYIKDGEECTKMGISFQPVLKTKLLGVLGSSFLKCQSPYATIYYGYKNRLMNNPKYAQHTPKHIHNMANRYMIKMFVKDLWLAWRELEGLPTEPDYAEAYLGRNPHGFNAATGEVTKARAEKS